MRIVLLGAPGSGKGTQAAILKTEIEVAHVSTGEMLRAAVAKETALGLEAKAVMERGDLVSDELVLGMLRERLEEPDCANGFILDGYPRNLVQGEALEGLLTELNAPLDQAVLISVDTDQIIERLSLRATREGRADDTAETVRKRMDVYNEQTAPLIEFYDSRDQLIRVDGLGSVDEVAARVLAAVTGD